MLNQLVKKANNKKTINDIVDFVGDNQEDFDELIHHFISGNTRVAQLVSWAIGDVAEKYPHLVESHHHIFLKKLADDSVHNSVRRNVVRIYQTVSIPEEIEGELYEKCINQILDPKEAIAIKVFSMTVCERIAMRYPDLIPELCDAIASQLPNGSAGIKNRGSKILKKLQSITN